MKQFFKKNILGIGIMVTIIIPLIALAGANDNVSGYAWSDMPTGSNETGTPTNPRGGRGMGWINLNGATYGVNLNETTGKFSGYGWSEHGGWVRFNPTGTPGSLGGAQVDPNCLANPTQNCPVTGWIKFLAGDDHDDGWDGWAKMSGPNYQVTLGPADSNGVRKMSGYAWGDWVVGWIDFKFAQVTTTVPPSCTSASPDWNPVTQTCQECNPSHPDWDSILGTCDDPRILGCMDATATNYNPDATVDTDPTSCEYPPIIGCMDATATNHNPNATQDTSPTSCTYPPVDVCPNLPGIYQAVPPGYIKNANGDCVPDRNFDICTNVPLIQRFIPQSLIPGVVVRVTPAGASQGNCIPFACKIPGRDGYVSQETTYLGPEVALTIVADNSLCGPADPTEPCDPEIETCPTPGPKVPIITEE